MRAGPRFPRIGMTVGVVLLAAVAVALAQSSTGYRVEEHVLDGGGSPSDGETPSSASYAVSFGSIAAAVTERGLSSASFRLDGGFVPAYPPPGEVGGLTFTAADRLAWDGEPSAGSYNLYREGIGALSGLAYGQCVEQGLSETAATDATVPATGDGLFYLVTVENRLHEEGTKGSQSGGGVRLGTACP